MLYPSPENWVSWGIADECHQFFCLHWTELFDPETPDTWQVRACNIKIVLRELIEASHIADGFDAYRGVMRSILMRRSPSSSGTPFSKNATPLYRPTSPRGPRRKSVRTRFPR